MRAHARFALLLALTSAGVAGCDDSSAARVDSGASDASTDDPASSDSGASDSGAVDSGPSGPPSATVTFGPDRLEVSEERTVCVVVDAGNDVARQVRAIRTHLPMGSHHMIVYRTDEPLRAEPEECFPFVDGGQAVFIAETVEAVLEFPADAALDFEPHQHIKLEIHEINYTTAPIDITASVTFDFYPADDARREPVRFLFTGDMAFTLEPRRETTLESFHRVPSGARIFGLTSHTHALGTYAGIHRARSVSDFDEDALHESTEWAEPPLDIFDPPLVLEANEGLRLTCTWFNPGPERVSFGLGFRDEMCFLWAYYY